LALSKSYAECEDNVVFEELPGNREVFVKTYDWRTVWVAEVLRRGLELAQDQSAFADTVVSDETLPG
jgi:hypothetical protein